jgi:hypothetical protein
MIMIGCTGPPTPEKFRMYHNLVAAPAFLVMIDHTATAFLYAIVVIRGLLLIQCQLGISLPAWTPVWTLVASLDTGLDFGCQPGRQLGLWLPVWTPAWTIVPAWTVELN